MQTKHKQTIWQCLSTLNWAVKSMGLGIKLAMPPEDSGVGDMFHTGCTFAQLQYRRNSWVLMFNHDETGKILDKLKNE